MADQLWLMTRIREEEEDCCIKVVLLKVIRGKRFRSMTNKMVSRLIEDSRLNYYDVA